MTTILERTPFIPPLLALLIVHLMIIGRVIVHKLLPVRVNEPVLNAVIDMIPELLVHREVLHPCGLIYQVNVRLLLLLRVVVHVRLSLQGHPVGLGLQLLVHLLEGGPLRAQVYASVVFVLLTQTLNGRGLVGKGDARVHCVTETTHAQVILLLQVDLPLKYVMNVGFLILSQHTPVVFIGASHSSISILKHLYTLLSIAGVILQTPPHRG